MASILRSLRGLETTTSADLPSLEESLEAWRAVRIAHGLSDADSPLMSDAGASVKSEHSLQAGMVTVMLYLAPARHGVCPFSTSGCREVCLGDTSGRMAMPYNATVRAARSAFLLSHPRHFLRMIDAEVRAFHRKYVTSGKFAFLGVRLNGTSDIPWEQVTPALVAEWVNLGGVRLYDYTKWSPEDRPATPSYDLTRSATERTTPEDIATMVRRGERVAAAVKFGKSDAIPAEVFGVPAVDGDVHDLRCTEDRGVLVVLRPKGAARNLEAGDRSFVKIA